MGRNTKAGSALTAVKAFDRNSRRAPPISHISGPDHPDVANGLGNLASLFLATNRLAEAEPLMRRALNIFGKSLGAEHPNTQTARANLEALLAHLTKDGAAHSGSPGPASSNIDAAPKRNT